MVWYSGDSSKKEMEAWSSEHQFPWPAIKYKSLDKMELIEKHKGSSIPNYVLVDTNNEVITTGIGSIKEKIAALTK